MRGNRKRQLARQKNKQIEDKMSEERKERKHQRWAKGKAEELAKALQGSPEGTKAAETLKAKRGVARRKEQANYQKTRSRASTRNGGKTKANSGRTTGKAGAVNRWLEQARAGLRCTSLSRKEGEEHDRDAEESGVWMPRLRTDTQGHSTGV